MSDRLSSIGELAAFYKGRSVLVTGHTGFKGAWLCEWLLSMGARVTGLSIDVPTDPSLFTDLGLALRLNDGRGDVAVPHRVHDVVAECQPDVVFHLAAQSVVRRSYEDPLGTFQTNVMGTARLLEAVKQLSGDCAVVVVTSDKCYENREWDYAYRECDPMGGHDPYSASKGCAELVAASYRRSFFADECRIRVATARAGNVIGGGDWTAHRIVPDAVRALSNREPIRVRNPRSVRPWQHVLEPLFGYLLLGRELLKCSPCSERGMALASGFNFGPSIASHCAVEELIERILDLWPGEWVDNSSGDAPHEARLLMLATHKARNQLGWCPVWSFAETVANTISWYRDTESGVIGAREIVLKQIEQYGLIVMRRSDKR
jgi:CDP-glucose 4,6-dehydratase